MSEEKRKEWFQWWFVNGGQIHRYWKDRKYSAIKDAAQRLPKAAWDYQQETIDEMRNRIMRLEAALIGIRDNPSPDGDGDVEIARVALEVEK